MTTTEPTPTTRTNGHHQPAPEGTRALTPEPTEKESVEVAALRTKLADTTSRATLLHQLKQVEDDAIFIERRSDTERAADRSLAETSRHRHRHQDDLDDKQAIRDRRRNRHARARTSRAERFRDTILNPARAIGQDYRRLIATSAICLVLAALGVLYMSMHVHDGLVGATGSWVMYGVEPLASVMLLVSLVSQFTARSRGRTVSHGFYWFDGALLGMSMVLNIVPFTIRYGVDTQLTGGILAPVLVTFVVLGWHLASNQYSSTISQHRPSDQEIACTTLLRDAYLDPKFTDITPSTSQTQAIRWLRRTWPGGIGQADAREAYRAVYGTASDDE